MKIIFVDGYNVINSWPGLKEQKEYSFQGARERLVEILHNYSVFNDCKIVIVFDAYNVVGNLENKEVINKNMVTIFTKDGETADEYIERQVNDMGRRYEVYVVTSDLLEQQTIFQRGAVRVSALEFYHQVLDTEKNIKNKAQKIKVASKNHLEDNIKEDVLRKLEIIRRSN